jgi:hypothetical protein
LKIPKGSDHSEDLDVDARIFKRICVMRFEGVDEICQVRGRWRAVVSMVMDL